MRPWVWPPNRVCDLVSGRMIPSPLRHSGLQPNQEWVTQGFQLGTSGGSSSRIKSTFAAPLCQLPACNSPLDTSMYLPPHQRASRSTPWHLSLCHGWCRLSPYRISSFSQQLLARGGPGPCTSPGHRGLLSPNQRTSRLVNQLPSLTPSHTPTPFTITGGLRSLTGTHKGVSGSRTSHGAPKSNPFCCCRDIADAQPSPAHPGPEGQHPHFSLGSSALTLLLAGLRAAIHRLRRHTGKRLPPGLRQRGLRQGQGQARSSPTESNQRVFGLEEM